MTLPTGVIDHGFHAPGFHICGPRGVYWRSIRMCPEEGAKRRFVVFDEPWYGMTFHCCGCGDSWDTESGRQERPFAPGWRHKAIAKHKELWRQATTRRLAMKWLKEEMGF